MEQEYSRDLKKIFNFLAQVEKLKFTLRYNATTSGRKESVADHNLNQKQIFTGKN